MKIRLAVLFAVIWLAAAVAFAQKSPTHIPFTRSKDGLLMIPASTGAGTHYSFVLDSGAGLSVLSKNLVEKLGGKPAGQFTGFRMTGERMDLQLYTIPELRVGPVLQKAVLVGAWNGLDQFHIDGIISLNFFRKHPITLDFLHNQLIFETAASLAQRRRSGSTVPVRFDDERGISLDLFAPFLVGSHPADCEVDTGSQGYMIQQRYMKLLGLSPQSSGVKQSSDATILGHKEFRYSTTIPSLALQGVPASALTNPPVMFQDMIYDCVIGSKFWAGRSVTFDVPGKSLILSAK